MKPFLTKTKQMKKNEENTHRSPFHHTLQLLLLFNVVVFFLFQKSNTLQNHKSNVN